MRVGDFSDSILRLLRGAMSVRRRVSLLENRSQSMTLKCTYSRKAVDGGLLRKFTDDRKYFQLTESRRQEGDLSNKMESEERKRQERPC